LKIHSGDYIQFKLLNDDHFQNWHLSDSNVAMIDSTGKLEAMNSGKT